MLEAARVCRLVTTDRAVLEVSRRIELGLKRPELLAVLDSLLEQIAIVPLSTLAAYLPRAQSVLRDSVPSRNGSTADAHILALVWAVDADVWSHDRDFAGTGVGSWSTLNLVRTIGEG
jgi:hypothetical protein